MDLQEHVTKLMACFTISI